LNFFQLKATDHIRLSKNKRHISFSISKKDLNLWGEEIFPVYMVVFDARREQAHWVYLQEYFSTNRIRPAKIKAKSITIKLNVSQRLNEKTIRTWRADKARLLQRIGRVNHA
jgi:hypothetical protein